MMMMSPTAATTEDLSGDQRVLHNKAIWSPLGVKAWTDITYALCPVSIALQPGICRRDGKCGLSENSGFHSHSTSADSPYDFCGRKATFEEALTEVKTFCFHCVSYFIQLTKNCPQSVDVKK